MNNGERAIFPFLANGITQIGWVVKDLDEAVKRFYEYTKIGPWSFYTYGSQLLSEMKMNGVDTEYKMYTAVANAGPLRLEIIQPVMGEMVYEDHIQKHGFGGVQHFGIAVQNIKESLKIVRNAGINVVMEGKGYGPDGDGHFAYLDTVDIFGIMLELMERPKRRFPPEKVYPDIQ